MEKQITITVCDDCQIITASGSCVKCGKDLCSQCAQLVSLSAKSGDVEKSKSFARCSACAAASDDLAVIAAIKQIVKDAIS